MSKTGIRPETISRAAALRQRADAIYELLRAERYPGRLDSEPLHPTAALRLQIEAMSIAIVEAIEASS